MLAVTRVLTPEQAFAGFANDIVVFEFTLLAMTQGLAATGVIQMAGRRLARFDALAPVTFPERARVARTGSSAAARPSSR